MPLCHNGNHMVTNDTQLDLVFSALGDRTRRAILERLAHGETTVGELAEPFHISRPAISKHLRVLERAGRISRCELDAGPMRDAAEWVEEYRRFWEDQLDSLARYLEKESSTEPKEKKE